MSVARPSHLICGVPRQRGTPPLDAGHTRGLPNLPHDHCFSAIADAVANKFAHVGGDRSAIGAARCDFADA